MTRVAVVGGGIAGLAAAFRLQSLGVDVVVVEQSTRPGGKLRTGEVAGLPVELGAENFLVHDPGTGGESAAMRLARQVGFGDDLVHPALSSAALAIEGALKPLPAGTLMGVPGRLELLGDVAKPAAGRDHDGGRPLLAPGEDAAVGQLVRDRLGDQVVDRLVDPMLGGVYAGRADLLSLAATMPGLAAACTTEHTLTTAVRSALAASPRRSPVFATVAGGVERLVSVVAAQLPLRLGSTARELHRTATGWSIVLGPVPRPSLVEADAVVLAVPAKAAARLLSDVAPAAAGDVGTLDYASVALVTLALPAVALPELSGFLVPAGERFALKAATFFTRKWPHLHRPDGTVLVRGSLGRYGEEQVLQRDDADLVQLVRSELSAFVGPLPSPVDSVVQRWGGALPQYAPGHVDRVGRARAALPRGLALAGAAYDGVGIPACIRSGETAADAVLAGLRQSSA